MAAKEKSHNNIHSLCDNTYIAIKSILGLSSKLSWCFGAPFKYRLKPVRFKILAL